MNNLKREQDITINKTKVLETKMFFLQAIQTGRCTFQDFKTKQTNQTDRTFEIRQSFSFYYYLSSSEASDTAAVYHHH